MARLFFNNRTRGLVFVCILVVILPFSSYSQKAPEGAKVNNFATIISSDQTNTQFSLDMNQLPGFFERACLLELLFADARVVILQTNISGSALEVFSSVEHDPIQIRNVLSDYRNKAIQASEALSSEKKDELMKKYKKFR